MGSQQGSDIPGESEERRQIRIGECAQSFLSGLLLIPSPLFIKRKMKATPTLIC